MKTKLINFVVAGILLLFTMISCSKDKDNMPQPSNDKYFPEVN